MAASQIPNLLSHVGNLRSRKIVRRHGLTNYATLSQESKDLGIQSTDTDAAVSRLSAVSLGYLIDPYASIFVQGPSTRRLPIINRGLLLLKYFSSALFLVTNC